MKKITISISTLGMLLPFAAFAQDAVPDNAAPNAVPGESAAVESAEDKPAKRGFDPIAFDVGKWNFKFGGFMQTAFDVHGINTSGDIEEPAPHTGFAHLNARLNFDISYNKKLSMRMSLDGAGGIDVADGGTEQSIDIKDIYIDYKVVPAFRMRLGQFKPPLDLENLISETDAFFTRRSIVSSGGSAFLVGTSLNTGFSPSRELGLSLYSDVIGADGPVGFKYNVAVTNGNKATELLNDDEMFAVYARLELGLNNSLVGIQNKGHFLTLAGGFSYEMFDYTPDNVEDNDDDSLIGHTYMAYAELRAAFRGFALDAEFQWRQKEFGEYYDWVVYDTEYTTCGILAQIAYTLPVEYWRFQFAYRFAAMFTLDEDGAGNSWDGDVMQHTAAIAYLVENYPILIRAEYIHNDEYKFESWGPDDGIGNDIFSLMVQVKW